MYPVTLWVLKTAGGAIAGKLPEKVWSALQRDPAQKIYDALRQKISSGEGQTAAVFQKFFANEKVDAEFQKLRDGHYEEMNFDRLEAEMRAAGADHLSLQADASLVDLIDVWARQLHRLLGKGPEMISNYSLALRHYQRFLARHHSFYWLWSGSRQPRGGTVESLRAAAHPAVANKDQRTAID
jgi:hypothetical protein